MRILLLLALIIGTMGFTANGQAPIVNHATSWGADTTIIIIQPQELSRRLEPGAAPKVDESKADQESDDNQQATPREGKPYKGVGYRVQVFSDNNARTAKNASRVRQRTVSARFPKYRAYVTYSAPYWRTRVGDFKSERQANAAAAELRRAFPKFSKEIRVVRDRISATD